MKYPSNIIFLRTKAGLSQKELSKLAGVGQDSVSFIERGLRRPRFGTKRKLTITLSEKLGKTFQVDEIFLI
jgi:transcriptional regulator with XRE-family HTH domain